MRWKSINQRIDGRMESRYNARMKKLLKWHKWFAWFPVTVLDSPDYKKLAWLEVVERCGKLEERCFPDMLSWRFEVIVWSYREEKRKQVENPGSTAKAAEGKKGGNKLNLKREDT